eukprot:618657-Amphidinium_carterae.1
MTRTKPLQFDSRLEWSRLKTSTIRRQGITTSHCIPALCPIPTLRPTKYSVVTEKNVQCTQTSSVLSGDPLVTRCWTYITPPMSNQRTFLCYRDI